MGAVQNLVFSGGGVRGVAYVGAIDVLEQRGHLAGVSRVAGASAGAITAGLLAAGADAATFARLFADLDFPSFMKDRWGALGDFVRVLQGFGLHTGDPLKTWLRDAIGALTKQSLGEARPDLTLGELDAAARAGKQVRRFYAVTTNLSHQLPEILCATTAPGLELWAAMRMSASFPMVFQAFRRDGSVYVDGGVSWNYPIDLFDGRHARLVKGALADEDRRGATIGFVLGTPGAAFDVEPPRPLPIVHLRDYARALTSFALSESTRLHTSRDAMARTVFIDDLGLSAVDFSITKVLEDRLIENGRAATGAFLDRAERG